MGRKKNFQVKANEKVSHQEEGKRIFSLFSPRWHIIFLLLLAGLVWGGFFAIHTNEIAGSDDREYASIARNIVNGKGVVRNFIYPVDINFFEKLPVPDFVHPPGYPLILAGFFKLFGISDFIALIPSYISYFILVLLVFYFARRYLEIKKAVFASILFVFNREILNMSLIGLSEIVYTLIFFLFFILFIKADSLKSLCLSGIMLGIGHLIRENIYPLLVPTLVYLYIYTDTPRLKKIAVFISSMFVPIIPNLIRSYLDTGTPFFSYGKFILMAYTEKHPWLNIYRGVENPSLIEFLTEEGGQFFLKYLSNLVLTFENLLSVSNPYILTFFLAEMFYWKITPELKKVKILFLSIIVFQIFFISLFTFTERYFIPFIPLMIFFASQGFMRMFEHMTSEVNMRWGKKALLFSLIFVFFMMPYFYKTFISAGHYFSGFKAPQYGFIVPRNEAESLNKFLREELKENQTVWTDLPEILEWEGDRLCGWLPTKIQSIYEIHKKIPVDAILLTSMRTPYKFEEEWKYLLFSEHTLPKYRNVKLYKRNNIFAKLLIRDEKD